MNDNTTHSLEDLILACGAVRAEPDNEAIREAQGPLTGSFTLWWAHGAWHAGYTGIDMGHKLVYLAANGNLKDIPYTTGDTPREAVSKLLDLINKP